MYLDDNAKLVFFREFFPFHLVVDSESKIVQFGEKLLKIFSDIKIGLHFFEEFKVIQPSNTNNFYDVLNSVQLAYIIQHNFTGFKMKSQIAKDDSSDFVTFLCTPIISDINRITDLNLTIDDFPIYNSLPDYLFILNAQKKALEEAEELSKKLIKKQKNIKLLNSQLKKQNSDLEQFIYILYHDLQEPLVTINGITNLIQKKYISKFNNGDEKLLEYLVSSSSRIQSQIKDLLEVSILGKVISKDTIDCQEVLEDVVSDLSVQIKKQMQA